MGEMRNAYNILVPKNLKGREHLEDLGVDGRIILEWVLEGHKVGRCGLAASGSGCGPVAGCCERGNEPSISIKGRESLEQLSDCQLLKKGCAPWSQSVDAVCVISVPHVLSAVPSCFDGPALFNSRHALG
jgi:hypothetical protein